MGFTGTDVFGMSSSDDHDSQRNLMLSPSPGSSVVSDSPLQASSNASAGSTMTCDTPLSSGSSSMVSSARRVFSHLNQDGALPMQSTAAAVTQTEEKLKLELQDILAQHALGDIVLASVATRLDSSKRTILVDILANDMVKKFGRPSRLEYERYCSMIKSLFPEEFKETYFIPSINCLNPRGKLYSKVCNIVAKKRTAGCIVKKQSSADVETASWELLEQGNVTDIDDAVNWLKLYNEPESKLVDLWRKTARTRLLFINSSEEVTLLKVLDEWPRYRDARGHVLVSEDFAAVYPASCNQLCRVLPDLSDKLLRQLFRVKDKQSLNLVYKLTEGLLDGPTDHSASKMTASLVLLPLLLPESSVATLSKGKGRKRSYFKPSVAESMAWFVDIQKPGLDINDHLSAKSSDLDRRNAGKLQPHVLVLAADDTLRAEHSVYAVIQGGLFYKVESIPAAVDVCLKASFVFGLKYPLPAHSSWTFLQRAVYNIKTNKDSCSNRVLELLTSLK